MFQSAHIFLISFLIHSLIIENGARTLNDLDDNTKTFGRHGELSLLPNQETRHPEIMNINDGRIRILKRTNENIKNEPIRILKRTNNGRIRILKRTDENINDGRIRILKRTEENINDGRIR